MYILNIKVSCPYERSFAVPAQKPEARDNAKSLDAASMTLYETISASKDHYLSATFSSASCSMSKPTVESCPHSAENMSAVLPFLHTKRLRRAIHANQHDTASST